jgi:hypothetical protein
MIIDSGIVTGSLLVQGPLTVSGSLSVTDGITGSLQGTASYASIALTASYVQIAQTASYVQIAQTASYVVTAQTASYVQTAQTASYVLQAVSASYWSGSIINAATASYVAVAKKTSNGLTWGNGITSNPPLGSMVNIDGTPTVVNSFDGSYPFELGVNITQTSGYSTFSSSIATINSAQNVRLSSLESFTSSYSTGSFTGSFTGSLLGTASTASYIQTAQTASYVLNAVSSSYATNALNAQTASYANNFTVAGTLSAQTIVVQTITSSVDFVTGSTRFGSNTGNTHQFTGSVSVSGSLQANGSDVVLSNQTSSMSVATSSYATQALSASYWSGSITNSESSSYALTASNAPNYLPLAGGTMTGDIYAAGRTFTFQDLLLGAGTTFGKLTTDGSKYISVMPTYNVESARFWPNGNVTIQDAGTYVDNGFRLDVSGSGRFTDGLTITGSLNVANGITGSLLGTASYATQALSASYWSGSIINAESASYAATASYALNVPVTASYANNSDLLDGRDSTVFATTGSNIFVGNQSITGSLTTTEDATIRNAYIGLISAFGSNYTTFSHISRNGTNDYSLLSDNAGITYLNAKSGSDLRFRVDNIDKVVIDSNGNLGVNKIAPNTKLDVDGNATITGSLNVTNGITGSLFGTSSNAITSSYALSANTASYALTASYISGSGAGVGFPFSGSAIITGSLFVSSSFISGSFVGDGSGITGLTAGGKIHTQSTAASTWTVSHNLGVQYPNVTVYNASNEIILPQTITATDSNTLVLEFGSAITGYAIAGIGGIINVQGRTTQQYFTSATTWSFAHNLGDKYVSIQAFDDAFEMMIPSTIRLVDYTSSVLLFESASSGYAVATIGGDLPAISSSYAGYTLQVASSAPYSASWVAVPNVTVTNAVTASYLNPIENSFIILSQVSSSLNFVDDIAAAAGGVPLGGLYRSGNFILIRLV